ncbi:hypothetical protein BKA82DRAFT_4338483 [Pisolithus tinctorius]|nr:hypothetical protein BKA82DRAFT_4338483 [Pisolithus tinctorius]
MRCKPQCALPLAARAITLSTVVVDKNNVDLQDGGQVLDLSESAVRHFLEAGSLGQPPPASTSDKFGFGGVGTITAETRFYKGMADFLDIRVIDTLQNILKGAPLHQPPPLAGSASA